MANIYEPTQTQVDKWNEWVESRPEQIRSLIQKHNFAPWKLYLLKTSGHKVELYSFDEGEPPTLKVLVHGRFNLVSFERRVFGISPDDLEECDLPKPDDPLGVVLTKERVESILKEKNTPEERLSAIREATKKELDLFKRIGEYGKA
jgi:hypothetical protein